jgi:PAS domain S-box-containing protein
MDLITHGVLVVAAVCFTLGFLNVRLWFGSRERMDLLAIAAVSFFGGTYSLFEVAWLHNTSPYEFGQIARWSQIASWGSVVSLAIFLRLHLKAGRTWLLYAVVGIRTLGMVINFVMPVNIQFLEMTAVEQVTILGEKLSYPIGIPNPWHAVQALSLIALFAFALDVLTVVWRRGEHRRALVFGGGVALLSLTSLAMAGAIIWFSIKLPPFASPAFMFVIVGMAIEFEYDLRRSARLAGELSSREIELSEALERLNLSANAGNVGIWVLEPGTGKFWLSQKMRELFGFDDSETVTVERYFQRVHPDDRERLEHLQNTAVETNGTYEAEYRVRLRDGDVRWIRSMGQVRAHEPDTMLFRGASVDITRRKLAEQEAHEMSHRLMDAQEKERARLARELHDDLSQSLAILSIQLQSLVSKSDDAEAIKKHVEKLTGQVERLSSDVHRISHELHPSKLNQLGLESALRGFCREVNAAHGLKIGFNPVNVPRSLPNDISLCLYRIAQEALQNVVKHSGASMANVALNANDGLISLVVSDNGNGFDTEAVRAKESLGLISMSERIRAVGGKLTVQSVVGSGSRIEAQITLPN